MVDVLQDYFEKEIKKETQAVENEMYLKKEAEKIKKLKGKAWEYADKESAEMTQAVAENLQEKVSKKVENIDEAQKLLQKLAKLGKL